MALQIALWLAQADSDAGYKQTEYPIAYGLIAALVLLGLLAVSIPRFRKKLATEEGEDKKKNRVRR